MAPLKNSPGLCKDGRASFLRGREGLQKKKIVSFLAPDGEEIRNKTQLNKYLKAHPGTAVATDFDWGTPAVESVTAYTTRRSERLSLKSRSSSEAIDKEIQPKTPVKRARKTRDNGAASKDTSLGKGEPVEKTGSEEAMDIPADQALHKKEETVEDNGNHKTTDLDVPKSVTTPVEEIKRVTAENLPPKSETEKKIDAESPDDGKIKETSPVKDATDNTKGIDSQTKEDAKKDDE